MPSRRGFLRSLLGGAAIAAADPERLLWTSGKKLISIPAGIIHQCGNQLITPQIFARESLTLLQKKFNTMCSLQMEEMIYSFDSRAHRIGDTMTVRRPHSIGGALALHA